MYQAIPLPSTSSFNGFTSARPITKNEFEFHQHTHLYKESQSLFGLEVLIESTNSTFHFDLWWNRKIHTYFMNSASDMVSPVFLSTEITTKYMKPSYEMTSTSITPANTTIACSTNHNVVSPLLTDSDSDDDTAIISQAIKKRRTTTSNTTGPISHDSTPSHAITQVQEDPTIPSPTNLDATLSISANTSVDVSHEIDPHLIVTIDPPLTETEMSFNSHLIIEDITEAERNSDVDDFLIDHDPTQNSDCELALRNNSELHTAEVVEPHVFGNLENFFNQNPSPQVVNTQLAQSDKKKIDAVKKVLLEMVGTGFDIVTEEEAQNNFCKSIAVLIDTGFFPDSMKSAI
ncbi:hypothetical protein FNV43_RR21237 [Rhamnella rubrinervis]|uniref:Uncharacterized protein n=1 Tax=Rhamnella rubrinervis TaxID=2594499 RepID=A0A8K0GXM1_9ROSA|nr:hypothetical protein FNV43_RR21237 [Rhamnella rubrinervis]